MALGKVPGKEDSREWFRKEAQRVVYVNNDKLLKDPRAVTELEPGKMYLFAYDPKWKDKLPYYDTYPLVFPFRVQSDRVHALNLHYLPPALRAQLMDALYTLVDKRFSNENKKLRLSYEVLKAAAKFKAFKPCVKTYLKTHFMSKFLLIPYDQWDVATMLPLARFKKAAQKKVHEDSERAVNG